MTVEFILILSNVVAKHKPTTYEVQNDNKNASSEIPALIYFQCRNILKPEQSPEETAGTHHEQEIGELKPKQKNNFAIIPNKKSGWQQDESSIDTLICIFMSDS